MSDNAGDGVALVSTEHPIEVTDAMLIAGENAWRAAPRPSETVKDIARDIFVAMARAEPVLPDDISEDSVEDVEIEVQVQGAFLSEADIEALRHLLALVEEEGIVLDQMPQLSALAERLGG